MTLSSLSGSETTSLVGAWRVYLVADRVSAAFCHFLAKVG
jgi:hypothetical protein